jgi:hypothetical protein
MKKPLRFALTVAVLASLAPFALGDPGGTNPQPQAYDALRVAIVAILSLLGL